MTALTATKTTGAANNGSGMSVAYHHLKLPMDEVQHTYSVANSGGKVSLVSITGQVASGRSVEILGGGTQLYWQKAAATDVFVDVERAVDTVAAALSAANTNVVINFGTTGAATDILTVVLSTPL